MIPELFRRKVSKFLIQCRYAEHATTKKTSANIVLVRALTNRLDRRKRSLKKRVECQLVKLDRFKRYRQFDIGKSVAVRDYCAGDEKCKSGTF